MTAIRNDLARMHRRKRMRNNLAGYTFLAPWLFGFIAFTSIPMLYSLYLAFTKYDSLGTPQWIGTANFVNMFQDGVFWKSVGITFKYVFILVPLRLAAALGVAGAADMGVAKSLFNIGTCYDMGWGVEKNREEALKWYRKAADQGLPEGNDMFKLLMSQQKK